MRRTSIIILVVVLVILIAVEAFLFFGLRDRIGGASASAGAVSNAPPVAMTQSPEMTIAPTPTAAPATPTPEPTPTATPEVTPEPTATPAPTAPPTATPEPVHSGTLTSDTGTELNITVDWETEDLGNGTTRIHLTGKVVSYSLMIQSSTATITLGDESVTCDTPSLNIGGSEKVTSDLFTADLDVPSGTSGTLTVDWNYRGSYSGVSLPHITASGDVSA